MTKLPVLIYKLDMDLSHFCYVSSHFYYDDLVYDHVLRSRFHILVLSRSRSFEVSDFKPLNHNYVQGPISASYIFPYLMI